MRLLKAFLYWLAERQERLASQRKLQMLIDAHQPRRNTLPWDIVFWVFVGSLAVAIGSIIHLMVGR